MEDAAFDVFPEHRSHTLVVVPPAIEDAWRETIDLFRLDNCDTITNGSLHKVKHPEKYDLIIVDEAHKFRNDTADAFDDLQRICKSPTRHFLPDGSRASKRVILVSATPLNNRPGDIRNLISLFQDLKDSTLSIANLQHFFAQREKEYTQARLQPDVEEARKQVKATYELIRTKVISEVTVRRTRTDLLEHDDYKKDLEEHGVIFPKIEPPRKILYQLPAAMEDLYDRTVAMLSDPHALTYNRYRAIGFLKPDKKQKYQHADRISLQLATIMRTLLIKRLDSSFFAFKQSLNRFRDATSIMRDMFARGTVYIAPNLNVTQFLIEGREEELIAKIAERQPTDPTIEICSPSDFEPGFTEGLEQDWQKLDAFCQEWDKVKADPKLDEFLRCLKDELFDRRINHEGKKLVVFSESKETTTYLLGQLAKAGYTRVLTVSSDNRAERMPIVRANFDASVAEKAHDYDILLSTEVLAEGVNLHRANVIVNYDTPWNSTRLMQRVGRVNRIGATAPRIYIYNFYPTACVDDDIELRKKAIMKLQAFHTALGEDSQIYSESEEVDNFGLFDRSPEEEERDERLALLMELRQFRQQHPEQFRRIKGLPLRARVGRADPARAGGTVTFIRNQRRDAFYRLSSSAGVPPASSGGVPAADPSINPQPSTFNLEEISLLEAAAEFRAPDPAEKAIPLHAAHHDHINTALTAAELQTRLAQPYDRASWLDTIGKTLSRTEIFAAPQPVPAETTRAEAIVQLGKVHLAGQRNLALLEVTVGDRVDLLRNRVGLRQLVARYIDQAEYHGVLAIFHQRDAKDYRFTFAAREATLDAGGQLVRHETAPRRYSYLLGPNESCRTAAERFALLAARGDRAEIKDIVEAFSVDKLNKEFFADFRKAFASVVADLLARNQDWARAEAEAESQTLLSRLLFLYFIQRKGWLNRRRDYLVASFRRHDAEDPEGTSFYDKFLKHFFVKLASEEAFFPNIELGDLPFLNGGLFDDEMDALIQQRAVEICKLRLWISLMVDYPLEVDPDNCALPDFRKALRKIAPLPNLDFKIRRANSLIEYIRGHAVNFPQAATDSRDFALSLNKLASAKHRFYEARRKKDKRAARLDILEATAELARYEFSAAKLKYGFLPTEKDAERVAELARAEKEMGQLAARVAATRKKGERQKEDDLERLSRVFNDEANPTFVWQLDFAEIFHRSPRSAQRRDSLLPDEEPKPPAGNSQPSGFDLVLANPPYVRQEKIKDQKPLLQNAYECYTGVADLYVYFYERGVRLLGQGGVLSFISSNKFFRAAYGEKLRAFLRARTELQNVIDFGDLPIFEATAYPCIIVASNRAPQSAHEVRTLNVRTTEELARFAELASSSTAPRAQTSLSDDPWQLESPLILRLLEKLHKAGKPLRAFTGTRLFRGITTGFNEAFVVDRATRDRMISESKSSSDLFRPYLRGKDVKPWRAEFAHQYLIKIESSENKSHPWSGKPEEEAEGIFAEKYPAVHARFSSYRDALIERDDQGKYFWELRSCRYWQDFELHKIVSTKVSIRPTFTIDTARCFLGNTSYFLPVTSDQYYILALLNSAVFYTYAKKTFVEKQGGWYEIQPDGLESFPIPSASAADRAAIEKLAEKCLAAHGENCQAWESEINDRVYRLYGLDKDEIKVVEEAGK